MVLTKPNEEIADELSVTKQNVNLIIKGAIRRLHKSASWKLKAKYPLESLSTHKPLTLASRRRLSEAGGGIAVRVEQMISQGKTPAEIKQKVGGSERLGHARKTLSGWGIDVPLELNPILSVFKELSNTELSDKGIQALLDKVQNSGQYRVLLRAGLIVNLTSLARGAGLYPRRQSIPRISNVLSENKMPQGKAARYGKGEGGERKILGWYYFIAATLAPRASSILKGAYELQDLRINPVRVIGAPVETIPNTTELEWRTDKYRSVLKLAEQIAGRKVSFRKLNRYSIVSGVTSSDDSVSFYTLEAHGRLWYEAKHEGAVKEHLKMRLEELGII